MTLDGVIRLQEKWKAQHGAQGCQHRQLVDPFLSKNGRYTGYVGCMECGEVLVDPAQQLSSDKVKTLEELFLEEDT